MTKKDLVDIILQTNPVSNERELPARGLISRLIGLALNDIYFAIFKQEPAFINDYLKRYPVTTEKKDNNLSIATLPVSTLQFPMIDDAVRIYSQTEPYLTFIPIRMDEHSLIGEIEEVDETVSFEVKGKEIWIWGLDRTMTLIVEAIPAFETLLDTDDVKIPAGQSSNLIQTVRENLGVSQPRPILNYKSSTQA